MISARRGPAYAAPAMGRMGKATMSRYDGKKVKAVFGGKGFYIALAVCLLAAGIVGYYTLLRPQAPAEPAAHPNPPLPDERVGTGDLQVADDQFHLAFEVDDVAAAVGEVEGKGVACEPIRSDEYTGKRFVFFSDPDGLPIELYEK